MSRSIAALHVAKKQLGLDDETYRAKLSAITGKTSAKDMSEAERQEVLTVFRNEGFQPKAVEHRPDGRKKLTGKFAPKLQALWIAAWNLGLVNNRDDAALLAFVKRQTGIDHTRFLTYGGDASKAIEALKGWMAREADVDWRENTFGPDWQTGAGYKIAAAQWRNLNGNGADFLGWVQNQIGRPVTSQPPTTAEWIAIMNTLGERIRARKAGA
ncbi:gp16 family protein [Martelella mediterranea]|uniref:Uncharacterized protein DUF1018 n=1 Tax=Martelella mediterranea TaxID=293089 RepID=A0A4R3NJV6_9HYPH|nr:regulatory protein GemA [Martelella mediterranea]TCT35397.1 uncharacterized protein DUF1018 [Martelella mediterranea]